MDCFLDRSAFRGVVRDAERAGAAFVGAARFSGWFACANWPRAALEALLPPALRLARNVSAAPEVHPLLFVFGEQSEGTILFGGMNVPMGVRYREFALAIPYVTRRDGRHLHTYVPRMYSSLHPPVRDGNVHYGFNKALAELERQGPIVTLTAAAGPLLWHAAVESSGGWCRAARAALPNLAALQAAFTLPNVGRKESGRYVRSYFGFDWQGAQVRPVRCAMSIDAPLVDGLAPQRCHSVAGGAFEVRGLLWRLSWPEPCAW
jgi:hypothetical protein